MATQKKPTKKTEAKTRKPPVRKPLPEAITVMEEEGEIAGVQTTVKFHQFDHEGTTYKILGKTEAVKTYNRLTNPPKRNPMSRFMTKCRNFNTSIQMFHQYEELGEKMEILCKALNTLQGSQVEGDTAKSEW